MKCNKCSSEWTTGSELSKCPFCGAELTEDVFEGTFEDVPSFLKYVFGKYTVDILKNKLKLLALASDYLSSTGGDFGLLRIAVEAGIYLPFIGIEESDVDAKCSDAVLKLTELHYIGKEHAEKAVSWITKALFEGKTATAQPAPSPVKASGASAAAFSFPVTKQKITLSDGEYEGETVFGVRHGYGVFTYKNGAKYEGEWRYNIPNGYGTFYIQDGKMIYQGEWKDGLHHGFGVLYDKDGSVVYEGLFLYGSHEESTIEYSKYHNSILQYCNGFIYERGKHEDIRGYGYGTHYYNGSIYYQGEFKDGEWHGYGTLYDDDGSIRYQGEWEDCKQHGYGTMYYDDGSIMYQGEFKYGEWHGYGTYYLGGSIWYQGDFKDGKYHGFGTWYNDDGSIYYQGEFENGEPKRK